MLWLKIAISIVSVFGCLWNQGSKTLPHRAWVENKAAHDVHKDVVKDMDENLRKNYYEPIKKRYNQISRINHIIDTSFLLMIGAGILPWIIDDTKLMLVVVGVMLAVAVALVFISASMMATFLNWDDS